MTRGHGGRGGIRTHGSFHFTRFPSVPIRPLSHPSSVLLRRRGRLPRWYGESLSVDECVSGEVPVGSCATVARETGQGRKTAAFSGHDCVPQIAWPSPHCSCAWCDTVHALLNTRCDFICTINKTRISHLFRDYSKCRCWSLPFPILNIADTHIV